MPFQSIFLTTVSIVAGLGVFAGGLGYLVSVFRKGGREEKSEAISSADKLTQFWKDQAEGYQKMMAEKDKANDEKFQKLTTEIGEIRGQLIEKEKQNKQYLEILQDRDPETKKFMEYMVQAVKDQAESHKEIARVLSEIHSMTIEGNKDLKINATISKN